MVWIKWQTTLMQKRSLASPQHWYERSLPLACSSHSPLSCLQQPGAPDNMVEFQLKFGTGLYVDDSLPFTYYNCSESTTCATCTSATQQDCGWCLLNDECTISSLCNSGAYRFALADSIVLLRARTRREYQLTLAISWADDGCPQINSLSPDSVPINQNRTIMVHGQHFTDGLELECRLILDMFELPVCHEERAATPTQRVLTGASDFCE